MHGTHQVDQTLIKIRSDELFFWISSNNWPAETTFRINSLEVHANKNANNKIDRFLYEPFKEKRKKNGY